MEKSLQEYERDVRQLLEQGIWAQAQKAAVDGLERYPAGAQLWVFLGESLEHQNLQDAAWAAYNRAWMLDPAASWVVDAQARCGRVSTDDSIPPWLQVLLTTRDVSITGAIIARNEEETIGQAVFRLKGAVDEVLVVDTGSDDQTKELARAAGARVLDYVWNDDFSAARNFALDQVTTDWVLWVDADELLNPADIEVPRVTAGLFHTAEPPVVLRLVQMNKIGTVVDANFDSSRMFRCGQGLRWWGRIHEQIAMEGNPMALPRPVVRIRVDHAGYDPVNVQRKDKLGRNIRLLRRAVEEDPENVVPWGFLGRDLFLAGAIEEAIAALSRAEELAIKTPQYGRLPEVRQVLAEALWKMGRLNEAIDVTTRQIERDPSYPGGLYLHGQLKLALAVQLLDEAGAVFRQALQAAPTYRGIVSFDGQIPAWKAPVGLADVAKLKGRWDEALQLYEKAALASPDNDAIKQQIQHLKGQSERIMAIR